MGLGTSKIVDDVVLGIDFGATDDDAEASEIEADGAKRRVFELLPAGEGCLAGVDAAYDNGDGG